jgi:SAM-dependent MidA family methyltransferase
MDIALYGPHGFYTTVGHAGRRGDFITSPEVGPLFGLILGNYLDAVWNDLGCPKQFDVVEVGAGPGTLARSILAASLECRDALRYVAVEISEAQRQRHPDGIISTAEFPTAPIVGVVLANELLDNLPFRLMVFDGDWRESWIASTPSGFSEELRNPSQGPIHLPSSAPHGARAPIQDVARRWVEKSIASLSRGRLLMIDYARRSTDSVTTTGWREWLRTYAQHGPGGHYLKDVGLQDITCDVMLDQVFDGTESRLMSQASFLESHGIAAAVEEGRTYWEAHASRPNVRAMSMRSRVSEAEALLDPSGLGAFTVAEVIVVS